MPSVVMLRSPECILSEEELRRAFSIRFANDFVIADPTKLGGDGASTDTPIDAATDLIVTACAIWDRADIYIGLVRGHLKPNPETDPLDVDVAAAIVSGVAMVFVFLPRGEGVICSFPPDETAGFVQRNSDYAAVLAGILHSYR